MRFEFTSYGGNNLYLDDINITAALGVKEIKPLFFFNVYPNPSDDDMTLDVYVPSSERQTIQLFNAQGELVDILHDGILAAGKQLIAVPHQPAGLYTIVMSKQDHMAVQRVVFR